MLRPPETNYRWGGVIYW